MYSFLTYLLLVISPSVHDLAFNSLVVNQTDRILSRGKWSPYVFSFIHTFVPVPGMSDGFPDSESELYEIYLDAMTEMPMANLERISNPVSWWQVRHVLGYHRTTNIKILSIRFGMMVPTYQSLVVPLSES